MYQVVLLSRRPRLMAAATAWDLPGAELLLYDSPAEALAKLSIGGMATFVFDTRDYVRYKHILRKFFSLQTDTDLVVVGLTDDESSLADQTQGTAVRHLPPDAGSEEIEYAVQRLLRLRRVRQTSGIAGRSRAISETLSLIAHAAPLDVNVLITGESGTGKELVARAIHDNSSRQGGPFLGLNCGALSEGVLESELFGHAKGAFTGAVQAHEGVFKRADGGTLFLDEVGEMPLAMQTRFLRALETGEFTPVGGRGIQKSDIRLVAATNQDLAGEVAQGRFRQDLYYRLRVVEIRTPPLRERKEDISVLARTFLEQENQEHGLQVRGLSRSAEQALLSHDWPGNVRELRNAIRSAAVLKQRGMIEREDLVSELRLPGNAFASPFLPVPADKALAGSVDLNVLAATMLELRQEIRDIKGLLIQLAQGRGSAWHPESGSRYYAPASMVETFSGEGEFSPLPEDQPGDLQTAERTLVEAALRATGGNRRLAAERLGISERTLYRKLKHYGLSGG